MPFTPPSNHGAESMDRRPPSTPEYALRPSPRFPVLADRVADGLVLLALVERCLDGRGKDIAIEERTHALDDVVIEGLVGLQFVADRFEGRIGIEFGALAACRGARAIVIDLGAVLAAGNDLGQPDAVPLGLIGRPPIIEGIEAV